MVWPHVVSLFKSKLPLSRILTEKFTFRYQWFAMNFNFEIWKVDHLFTLIQMNSVDGKTKPLNFPVMR